MDLLFKTKIFIERHQLIEPGDHVLIAVSGGIDSMTLLNLFDQLKDELGFLISVVHVNHKLRGNESDGDEKLVSETCNKKEIPFFSVDWNGPREKKNLQDAARNFRYETFIKLARKIEANKVALAHNLDDQAETVFLNLIRGAGLDGICGMNHKKNLSDGIDLIRPLLETGRKEIEDAAREMTVGYRNDATNDQTKYTRNFIRHKVMPLIRKINPNASVSISNMSRLLQMDEEYIQARALHFFDEILIDRSKKGLIFDKNGFRELELPIRSRILKLAYIELTGSIAGISRDHITKMDEIAVGSKKEGEYNLPMSLKFRRASGQLAILKI